MFPTFRKVWLAFAALSLLGACATDTRYDDRALIEAARYQHDGPPALTLFTMINARSESGAHTSLMINGSERIIFDPAGSVSFSVVPENADILYGITPDVARAYASAHARETYYVVIQRVEVPAAVAEQALQLALARGAVTQMYCAQSTSQILAQLPGFESITPTFFPTNLRGQFSELPGVSERVLRERDDDDKDIAIRALEEDLQAQR